MPTGIAAINAGGVTLHSLFQLPFGLFIPSDDLAKENHITKQVNTQQSLIKDLRLNKYKRSLLNEQELLIIDEVSMLRADLLDAIDAVLRYVRKHKNSPFGGIQILFIGDLLQLPPVVQDEEWDYLAPYYPGVHFFMPKHWRIMNRCILSWKRYTGSQTYDLFPCSTTCGIMPLQKKILNY